MIRRPRMGDFSPEQHRFIRACAYYALAIAGAASLFVPWWCLVTAGVLGVVWECWHSAGSRNSA